MEFYGVKSFPKVDKGRIRSEVGYTWWMFIWLFLYIVGGRWWQMLFPGLVELQFCLESVDYNPSKVDSIRNPPGLSLDVLVQSLHYSICSVFHYVVSISWIAFLFCFKVFDLRFLLFLWLCDLLPKLCFFSFFLFGFSFPILLCPAFLLIPIYDFFPPVYLFLSWNVCFDLIFSCIVRYISLLLSLAVSLCPFLFFRLFLFCCWLVFFWAL